MQTDGTLRDGLPRAASVKPAPSELANFASFLSAIYIHFAFTLGNLSKISPGLMITTMSCTEHIRASPRKLDGQRKNQSGHDRIKCDEKEELKGPLPLPMTALRDYPTDLGTRMHRSSGIGGRLLEGFDDSDCVSILHCGPFLFFLSRNCVKMPKNKGKGGKNRKKGKNENESDKRELVFKEEGQEYASVTKMLGNGWIEAQCMDGEKRLGHIRGAFRKKVWIAAGDLVLLGLRDYQDSKADIILKYTADEARLLKSYGELPDNVKVNENDVGGESEDDVDVEFDIDDI